MSFFDLDDVKSNIAMHLLNDTIVDKKIMTKPDDYNTIKRVPGRNLDDVNFNNGMIYQISHI
jgi:hypothetical protein